MSKKIQEYANDEISVSFDPNVCEHAAVCVHTLSNVFDVKKKPWVNVNGATAAEITEMIGRCPSGALKYQLKNGETPSGEKAAATEINVIANGPLRLQGELLVKDQDGNVILQGDKVSLCRCGASERKPFCDGSHKKIGFEA